MSLSGLELLLAVTPVTRTSTVQTKKYKIVKFGIFGISKGNKLKL